MKNLALARKNKPVSEESRGLYKAYALKRVYSDVTRLKMSLNNNKSVAIQAYLADTNTLHREFFFYCRSCRAFFQRSRQKRSYKIRIS